MSEGKSTSTEEQEDVDELGLKQELKNRMLEAFTLFADADGLLDIGQLGAVFRSLGQSPTVCEEIAIVTECARLQRDRIRFPTFLQVAAKRLDRFRDEADDEDQLRESFRRFDPDEKGVIAEEELRTMLTTMGEPLTEEQVDDWFKDGREFLEDGSLHYEDFATFMLSK